MRIATSLVLSLLLCAAGVAAQEEGGIYGVVRSLSPDGLFGAPVTGAVVTARDADGEIVARSVTEANGAYRLVASPGSYRLVARHPAFEDFDSGAALLLVQSGHFTLFNVGITAREPGVGTVSGTVLSEEGEPVEGASVVLRTADGAEVAKVGTDSAGAFSLQLTPGDYLVAADHTLRGAAEPVAFEVEDGVTVAMEIRLTTPPKPVGGFQGLVRARAEGGAAGRPIAGARVRAAGDGGFELTVLTNEIGFYKLALPPGRYMLSASHADFEPADSGADPLAVAEDSVRAWNALLRARTPLEGVQTCRGQYPLGVGSSYGERHTVFLTVRNPGALSAVLRWSGDATELALIARGPDGVPRRVDGTSPLRLTVTVGPELVARGFQWEISVRNFGGGRAEGTLSLVYPCEK